MELAFILTLFGIRPAKRGVQMSGIHGSPKTRTFSPLHFDHDPCSGSVQRPTNIIFVVQDVHNCFEAWRKSLDGKYIPLSIWSQKVYIFPCSIHAILIINARCCVSNSLNTIKPPSFIIVHDSVSPMNFLLPLLVAQQKVHHKPIYLRASCLREKKHIHSEHRSSHYHWLDENPPLLITGCFCFHPWNFVEFYLWGTA